MSKVYTIEDDFKQIVAGIVPLPNAEVVDPLLFLNNLAATGHSMQPHWGWAKLPDGSRGQWTQFFLTPAGMGGRLDGGGYAVTYGGSRWDTASKSNVNMPIVQRFSICKHEQVLRGDANPQRGWNPGNCKHCGLDMTVDSGD